MTSVLTMVTSTSMTVYSSTTNDNYYMYTLIAVLYNLCINSPYIKTVIACVMFTIVH